MTKDTSLAFEINLGPDGFVFDVQSLIAALMGLKDLRDARGLRYALVTVLVFVIPAKLSGEDFLRGIAQWVIERQPELTKVLGLVLGLFARLGYTNAAEARRHFAAHFGEAANLVLRAQT